MSRFPTRPEEFASPRELQEPGRPDAVRADDHDVGRLVVLAPRAIDVRRTARPAASVRRDAVHARAGDESHAALERLRPVREIGAWPSLDPGNP